MSKKKENFGFISNKYFICKHKQVDCNCYFSQYVTLFNFVYICYGLTLLLTDNISFIVKYQNIKKKIQMYQNVKYYKQNYSDTFKI